MSSETAGALIQISDITDETPNPRFYLDTLVAQGGIDIKFTDKQKWHFEVIYLQSQRDTAERQLQKTEKENGDLRRRVNLLFVSVCALVLSWCVLFFF